MKAGARLQVQGALAPPELRRAAPAILPARVHLVRLPARVSAGEACSVTLALHGAAVAHNLECVLTTLDPEGPHQLRIALRRTRVALRVFEPVMRGKQNARLVETARRLGRIAGELRDADVMIDEVIAPAARGETALLASLEAWRQEVRGRVRARLLAAGAQATAAAFTRAAAASAWLKADADEVSFADLIAGVRGGFWERAAPLAARLPELSHLELHQLRKAVKALRYGAELAASAGLKADALPRLKHMQDALGFANDMAALEDFSPPVFGEVSTLGRVRARLISARSAGVADAIRAAMEEWRALTQARAAAAN